MSDWRVTSWSRELGRGAVSCAAFGMLPFDGHHADVDDFDIDERGLTPVCSDGGIGMTAALVLRCANIETSRVFYEARLGVAFQREQHEAGPIDYSAMLRGLLIELYPADDSHPAGQTELMLPKQTDGHGVERDPDGRRILSLR